MLISCGKPQVVGPRGLSPPRGGHRAGGGPEEDALKAHAAAKVSRKNLRFANICRNILNIALFLTNHDAFWSFYNHLYSSLFVHVHSL